MDIVVQGEEAFIWEFGVTAEDFITIVMLIDLIVPNYRHTDTTTEHRVAFTLSILRNNIAKHTVLNRCGYCSKVV